MSEHRLKTWPQFFAQLLDGSKTFELRPDDRAFQVGDVLLLQEFNPDTLEYTGRIAEKRVTSVLRNDPWHVLKAGWCILSLGEHDR